jgi:hypothetical protein
MLSSQPAGFSLDAGSLLVLLPPHAATKSASPAISAKPFTRFMCSSTFSVLC